MRRCNPATKPEKPENGVVEGNSMLGGCERVVNHGHSHTIPASVPGDSGFEVSSFGLSPHLPPRQLSEDFSSFLPSPSTRCLRALQWASRTIQSKTTSILLFILFLFSQVSLAAVHSNLSSQVCHLLLHQHAVCHQWPPSTPQVAFLDHWTHPPSLSHCKEEIPNFSQLS